MDYFFVFLFGIIIGCLICLVRIILAHPPEERAELWRYFRKELLTFDGWFSNH
jgi:hypothetical protein